MGHFSTTDRTCAGNFILLLLPLLLTATTKARLATLAWHLPCLVDSTGERWRTGHSVYYVVYYAL